MYLRPLADFIEFLGQRNHSAEDVLVYLALRMLAPWECSSITLHNLTKYGDLELSTSFGADCGADVKIFLRQAIHQSTHIFTPLEIEGERNEHFLALPIELNRSPHAVMGICTSEKISEKKELAYFLQGIANLVALYVYQRDLPARGSHDYARSRALEAAQSGGRDLTQRQLLILKLIADGMTNLAIAEQLQYSESTIRQESIRIYAKLGCYGRHEAAEIYRGRASGDLLELAALAE